MQQVHLGTQLGVQHHGAVHVPHRTVRGALQHLHQETTITRKAGSFTLEECLARLVREGAIEWQAAHGRDVRRDLARAVVGSGFGLLELRLVRMSLEEVFLSLTTEESPVEEAHA